MVNFNPRSHEGSDCWPLLVALKTSISIHAPTRGATHCKSCLEAPKTIFQSTLPRGERHFLRFHLKLESLYFNPRSHEGSDNIRHFMYLRIWKFQSTLPRGERQDGYANSDAVVNFNPRSHEGSDQNDSTALQIRLDISIHAPTRGATDKQQWYAYTVHFNPRSHEGSDVPEFGIQVKSYEISIHAPTRGATPERPAQPYRDPEFQSTLPRGERPTAAIRSDLGMVYFNPRSHEGSDLRRQDSASDQFNFNPRSHEGSDWGAYLREHGFRRFQSTLPRGERLGPGILRLDHIAISIHAPTRGATDSRGHRGQIKPDFNPRSHEGSDL